MASLVPSHSAMRGGDTSGACGSLDPEGVFGVSPLASAAKRAARPPCCPSDDSITRITLSIELHKYKHKPTHTVHTKEK